MRTVTCVGGPLDGQAMVAYGAVIHSRDAWYAVVGDLAIQCDRPSWIPDDASFVDPEKVLARQPKSL